MDAMTKEQYNEEVRWITAVHPSGSAERRIAKQELWDNYEAQDFVRRGNMQAIDRLQRKLAGELFLAIKAFYSGELRAGAYRTRRTVIFRRYCEGMVKLGLARTVPNDAWIAVFSEEGIREELKLLPAKTTGLTDEDALLLCVPLRDKSKEVLFAFHSQFGTERLKNTPDIYVGIVQHDAQAVVAPPVPVIRSGRSG